MEDRIGSEDMEFLDFLSALLGRAEIERLVALRRNVCELKERSNHRKDAVNTFDRGNGLEKVLEMVECLPQGTYKCFLLTLP